MQHEPLSPEGHVELLNESADVEVDVGEAIEQASGVARELVRTDGDDAVRVVADEVVLEEDWSSTVIDNSVGSLQVALKGLHDLAIGPP